MKKSINDVFPFLLIFTLLFVNLNESLAQKTTIAIDERENYVRLANSYFLDENWEEGKKIVDEGLAKYPKNSDLRMLLGKYYFEKKSYDLARYELKEALQYDPNNVSAKQLLVNVEIESQRYSSAICYINELLEINPYWKGLWKKKIGVYRLQGNNVEADRLLKRINQIYPDDNEIRTAFLYHVEQEANIKRDEGKLNDAIALSAMLIEEDSSNEAFYLALINNCLKAGDYEKALVTTERGLYTLPDSINLINKKVDILSSLNRYDEALDYLKLKMKGNSNKRVLEQKYNYLLGEAANYRRKTDPYTLYSVLYDRNPRDDDAFKYVVNTAIANRLHDDALDAIKKAKSVKGETKDLLLKERTVYISMGAQSKADGLTTRLYELFPADADIRHEYEIYMYRQAKIYTEEELYEKALSYWQFVENSADEELRKSALTSVFNCYFQLGKFTDALTVADRLVNNYPFESDWRAKKAMVYAKQNNYAEALDEYELMLNSTPLADKERMLVAYDELATVYVKQLIEEYYLDKALQVAKHWADLNPRSTLAIRYVINASSQMKDYDCMVQYAQLGQSAYPGEVFYKIKLAEAYNLQKQHQPSLAVLSPEMVKNPHHHDLIKVHSQSSEDYAKQLINNAEPKAGLAIINTALFYDPNNKTLNYWKGIGYEKNKQYDSAHYYLSLYEPSPLEVKPFTRHLHFLKSKTYKNRVSASYLRGRFGDTDIITSVATLEYSRFCTKNTFTGRVNYTGRDDGKGAQAQFEWSHVWTPTIYTRIDVAGANDYFPSFALGGSIYKLFGHGWEAELGGGYRRLADDENMGSAVVGLAKEFEPWWLNARFNSFIVNSKWYYSLLGQARFELIDNGYLSAMGSFGSAPDVDVINYQLYNAFSVTNTMVGMGVHYLLNDKISVNLMGTWYNYKDENRGRYQNLYNLYIQLNVSF